MAILERSDNGPVARLTLNHPEKLNALSDAMLAALQDQFDRLAGDQRDPRGHHRRRRQGLLRRA